MSIIERFMENARKKTMIMINQSIQSLSISYNKKLSYHQHVALNITEQSFQWNTTAEIIPHMTSDRCN